MVAPPTSMAISSPIPGSPSVPSARRVIALSTAEGVGIIIPEISSEAFESPFASIIRRRNSSLISFCAGTMFKVPNLGITFSQTKVSRPLNMRLHSAEAARLPAIMTGKSAGIFATVFALFIMHSLLPPSVPPQRSSISGFISPISAASSSVSSNE